MNNSIQYFIKNIKENDIRFLIDFSRDSKEIEISMCIDLDQSILNKSDILDIDGNTVEKCFLDVFFVNNTLICRKKYASIYTDNVNSINGLIEKKLIETHRDYILRKCLKYIIKIKESSIAIEKNISTNRSN